MRSVVYIRYSELVETIQCKVKGCKNDAKKKEVCIMHYSRWYRNGSYVALKEISFERRFWNRIEKKPGSNGCWLWTGSASNGWGYIEYPRGTRHSTHRLAWTLTMGPIPKNHIVRHMPEAGCVSDLCCKPTHMEVTKMNQRVHLYCKNRLHQMTPDNILARRDGRRCKTCYKLMRKRFYQKEKEARRIARLEKAA